MKAIVIHEFGPPDVLKYEDVPDPQPRAGEIRIRVHAATVNRVLDVSLRAGKETRRAPELPLIPGVDCAGTVDALGPGVTRWTVGQHVAAAGGMPLQPVPEDCENYDGPQGMMGIKRPGGFAELVCVPACVVVPLPDGINFHDAAVVMRHCPTAWNLLVNTAKLQRGESVLIMGAGGNLGMTGIQIARNVIGAKVIATAGSDDRVKQGLALGADEQRRLAANLGTLDGLILENHGPLTVGRTVAEAWMLMYLLERAARAQLTAMAATRGPVRVVSDAVAAATYRQWIGDGSEIDGDLEWPALLRGLDRTAPGYRD